MHALPAILLSAFTPLGRIRLVFHLFVFQLLVALLVSVPLWSLLEETLAFSRSGERLQQDTLFHEPVWSDLHINQAPALSGLAQSASAVGCLWLLVSSVFLSAGTFWILASPDRASSWREFFRGVGELSGRYLRLALYYALGLLALFLLNVFLSGLVNRWIDRQAPQSSAALGYVLHGKTLLMFVLWGCWSMVFAFAKASVVLDGRRSSLGAFAGALVTAVRHPFSTPLLAGIGPVLGAGCVALYALARDHLPVETQTIALSTSLQFELSPEALYLLLSQAAAFLGQAVLVFWTAAVLRFHLRAHPPAVHTTAAPAPLPLTVVDRPAIRPRDRK